jgi:hypothetical protein
MNVLQHCKFVAAVKPAAIVNNNSVTATEVDARGYDYATFIVTLGATDIALTALKVQAASSSGGQFDDITGATFSAGSGFAGATLALPSATDDGQVCVFHIDLRGKQPFLKRDLWERFGWWLPGCQLRPLQGEGRSCHFDWDG